jgi:hypothetical protein
VAALRMAGKVDRDGMIGYLTPPRSSGTQHA